MSGKTVDYSSIYNGIYAANPDYCGEYGLKDEYVDSYAAKIGGKILDAGCGQGLHLKRLLKQGRDVFGIEVSEVCCRKYLEGVPHECADIVTFCRKNPKFDGVICMDVLEHLAEDDLDEVLKCLSAAAPSACFGIANHSDVQNGVELHVIQKDSFWWEKKLSKHYRNLFLVPSIFIPSIPQEKDIFFIFECHNAAFKSECPVPGGNGQPARIPAYDEAFFRQTKQSIRAFVEHAAMGKRVDILQRSAEDFNKVLADAVAAKDKQFVEIIAEKDRQFEGLNMLLVEALAASAKDKRYIVDLAEKNRLLADGERQTAARLAGKELELARVLGSMRYKLGRAFLLPFSALKDLLIRLRGRRSP